MKHLVPLALAAALAACAASAQTAPPLPAPVAVADIDCAVHATPTRHGTRLEAMVHAGRAISGVYEFTIAKEGAGGSSDIVQGGPFEAAAGASVTLGSAEIGADRRSHLRAVLRIDENGGELCRRDFRL